MGEITVLGIVALTVYALLRRFRPARESIAIPAQQHLLQRGFPAKTGDGTDTPAAGAEDMVRSSALVPVVLARLVLPMGLVVAIHLLMRGHNEPGGGFVAGLAVAVALITQYMAAGTTWVEAHVRPYPARWIAAGLLLAVATGFGSLLFGYPFLTTHTVHLQLPLLGGIHIPSAMFFDFGVFATVVGATLLILTSIAHQSLRGPRAAVAGGEAQSGSGPSPS
jgi:multicomponent K+:H+ antiporter subunit A